MRLQVLSYLCTLSLLATSAQASYVIDNLNSTVQYEPAVNYQLYNFTQEYDGTVSELACHTVDDCRVIITFVGSGITLFVSWFADNGAMNTTITVDGGAPEIQTLPYITVTGKNMFQQKVFDVQSLPLEEHKLVVTLVNYSSTNLSVFDFDYALVNDTGTTPEQKVQNRKSSGSSTPIGAIVGGVVGGVLAVAGAVLALLWRRRSCRAREEFHPEPASFIPEHQQAIQPFQTNDRPETIFSGSSLYSSGVAGIGAATNPHSSINSTVPLMAAYSLPGTPTRLSRFSDSKVPIIMSVNQSNPGGDDSRYSYMSTEFGEAADRTLASGRGSMSVISEQGPSSSTSGPGPGPSAALPAIVSKATDGLTKDQVIYVRGMHSMNAPIDEMLRVIETMRDSGDPEGSSSGPQLHAPPPTYQP